MGMPCAHVELTTKGGTQPLKFTVLQRCLTAIDSLSSQGKALPRPFQKPIRKLMVKCCTYDTESVTAFERPLAAGGGGEQWRLPIRLKDHYAVD